MKTTVFAALVVSIVFIGSPNLGLAAPSAQKTCAKMERENRSGGHTMDQCLCTYRYAEAILDDDLKGLVFDSWYNGTNNMAAVERLKPRRRIEKQLRKMEKNIRKNCWG